LKGGGAATAADVPEMAAMMATMRGANLTILKFVEYEYLRRKVLLVRLCL